METLESNTSEGQAEPQGAGAHSAGPRSIVLIAPCLVCKKPMLFLRTKRGLGIYATCHQCKVRIFVNSESAIEKLIGIYKDYMIEQISRGDLDET